jgi:diaminopimelate epimerase
LEAVGSWRSEWRLNQFDHDQIRAQCSRKGAILEENNMTAPITLTKHHGLGNDFLVLADVDVAASMNSAQRGALAQATCDRHRGIGADGLLFALPVGHPDAPKPTMGNEVIAMRLHNADGSIAEMSGNGIRCFAQAIIDAGVVPPGTIRISTDGGLRVVVGGASDASGTAHFRVDMGAAIVGEIEVPESIRAELGNARVLTVDVGNPHFVIERDIKTVNIATFGPTIEAPFLDTKLHGINVEVVALKPDSVDVLDMVVWERGVGVTQACGTGACATAVAAHRWGLVGKNSMVNMPGGAVGVELDGERITLVGPSQYICTITISSGVVNYG